MSAAAVIFLLAVACLTASSVVWLHATSAASGADIADPGARKEGLDEVVLDSGPLDALPAEPHPPTTVATSWRANRERGTIWQANGLTEP